MLSKPNDTSGQPSNDPHAQVHALPPHPQLTPPLGSCVRAAVKLVLKYMYASHLTLLCLVDSAPMRLWVLANTLLTYLYSVHLKPITGVKNATCAGIVAMAVGLGALAMGGGAASVAAVWRPMIAVGGLIWHREIVMDVKDMDGDRQAGVRTLPVALGADRAVSLSLVPLAVGAVAAATAPGGGLKAAVASAALLTQAGLALRARAQGYAKERMGAAIELAPLWLLTTLIALTL